MRVALSACLPKDIFYIKCLKISIDNFFLISITVFKSLKKKFEKMRPNRYKKQKLFNVIFNIFSFFASGNFCMFYFFDVEGREKGYENKKNKRVMLKFLRIQGRYFFSSMCVRCMCKSILCLRNHTFFLCLT